MKQNEILKMLLEDIVDNAEHYTPANRALENERDVMVSLLGKMYQRAVARNKEYSPREWVGLTKEEVDAITQKRAGIVPVPEMLLASCRDYALAIEAKLWEKNI